MEVDNNTMVAAFNETAYMFEFDGATWQEVALLQVDNPTADTLRRRVALSEDIIAVRGIDIATNTGAVYVFQRPATGWSGVVDESAKLTAPKPGLLSYYWQRLNKGLRQYLLKGCL